MILIKLKKQIQQMFVLGGPLESGTLRQRAKASHVTNGRSDRRPYDQMDDALQMTTRYRKGRLKVTDVTLEKVGVSSQTKATENADGSHGARRRISTRKRR